MAWPVARRRVRRGSVSDWTKACWTPFRVALQYTIDLYRRRKRMIGALASLDHGCSTLLGGFVVHMLGMLFGDSSHQSFLDGRRHCGNLWQFLYLFFSGNSYQLLPGAINIPPKPRPPRDFHGTSNCEQHSTPCLHIPFASQASTSVKAESIPIVFDYSSGMLDKRPSFQTYRVSKSAVIHVFMFCFFLLSKAISCLSCCSVIPA